MPFVSILGDSISTYEGFNPQQCQVYYDIPTQQHNGLTSVYDTWWAKVNQALRAYLCVNNAWSGSTVTGTDASSARSLHRTGALHTAAYTPDLILIYIGFNDFAKGIPIWTAETRLACPDPRLFAESYATMLQRIRERYPRATIVCATLMRTCIRGNPGWKFPETFGGEQLEAYNRAIRHICRTENVLLADLANTGLRYETLDGSHPTKDGHHTLYTAWAYCLSDLGLL